MEEQAVVPIAGFASVVGTEERGVGQAGDQPAAEVVVQQYSA